MPKVSIITTTYNYSKYIREAIQSVLDQTYKDYEMIIIDDGSTDDTKKQIQPLLCDKRIKYMYQENKGRCTALNNGLRNTTGGYVTFLDADDLFMPDKLELQVKLLDSKPDIDLVYSWWYYIDDDGDILPEVPCPRKEGALLETLLFDCFFPIHSTLIRRKCFDKVGFFDEEITSSVDWDMWLRMANENSKFAYVPISLVKYRLHNGSIITNIDRSVQNKFKIINKIYSQKLIQDRIMSLKNKVYFNFYLQSAIKYYKQGNEREFFRYIKDAFALYPEALKNQKIFYQIANNVIFPIGFRTKEGMYQSLDKIRSIIFNILEILFSTPDIKDKIYRYKKISYANAEMCLAMSYYYVRNMKKARSFFIHSFWTKSGLLFKDKNFFTFLKSFLGSSIIGTVSNIKREILNKEKIRKEIKPVVFFTTRNFDSFGGIERYINNFCKYYEGCNGNIALLCPSGAQSKLLRNEEITCESYENNFKPINGFFRFFNPIKTILSLNRSIKNKLKRLTSNLVLTRDWEGVILSILCIGRIPVFFMPGSLLKTDLKLDSEFSGSFFYRLSRTLQIKIRVFLESIAFKLSHRIIVFSKAFKQHIIDNYKINDKKIHIIPMGIDVSYIKNGLDIEKNLIFSVCRLTKSKNICLGLEAMRRLNGFKWVIAGEGPDRKYIENRIYELGLKNRVILLGQITDLNDYYEKCDIFMHLSYYENLGQVLLEAMLHGRPPIVLDPKTPNVHTASGEIIQDGYNGFFVENNPDKIAEKIRYVANLDKARISENCKEFVKRYSFENHLKELFGVINEDYTDGQPRQAEDREGV